MTLAELLKPYKIEAFKVTKTYPQYCVVGCVTINDIKNNHKYEI